MKKIISLTVALLMFFGMFNIFVFAEDDKKFYVVLGDSIAYGSGLKNSQEACYGKIVADTNGYDYVNHAVPGHTSTDLISLLDDETVISDIIKADIISISAGGNDFLKNNPSDLIFDAALEDDYSGFGEISQMFYENFSQIIDKINLLNPDAVIIMQTLYNPQSGDLGILYQHGVDEINSKIYLYAENNPGEIYVADVACAFGDDLKNIAKDGIHPSAKGNVIIAETILDLLFELDLGTSDIPVIAEEGKDIRASFFRNFAMKLLPYIIKLIAYFYRLTV